MKKALISVLVVSLYHHVYAVPKRKKELAAIYKILGTIDGNTKRLRDYHNQMVDAVNPILNERQDIAYQQKIDDQFENIVEDLNDLE